MKLKSSPAKVLDNGAYGFEAGDQTFSVVPITEPRLFVPVDKLAKEFHYIAEANWAASDWFQATVPADDVEAASRRTFDEHDESKIARTVGAIRQFGEYTMFYALLDVEADVLTNVDDIIGYTTMRLDASPTKFMRVPVMSELRKRQVHPERVYPTIGAGLVAIPNLTEQTYFDSVRAATLAVSLTGLVGSAGGYADILDVWTTVEDVSDVDFHMRHGAVKRVERETSDYTGYPQQEVSLRYHDIVELNQRLRDTGPQLRPLGK